MSSAIMQERGDEFAPGDGRQGTGNAVGRGEAEVAEGKTKGSGLYLYGIIQDNQERRWSLTGIGGAPAIYSICHDGLSAIVSDGCGEICETTQEDLLAHNHVLEQVMKTHSVLPLRWGTVARSEAEVRAFLQKAHRPLRDALGQIEGKVEFDVDAEWNGNEIFRLIEEQHEEVRKYKEHILATGKRPGSEEQLAAGIMVANAIARQRAQFAKAMEAELKPWSERVSSLQDRTKQTVFNAAFLVQEQRTKPFEEAIYRLGDLHGRILRFRYAGPLPCYNFVNLHVMMVEFQAVDEARRTLGLGDHITLSQIKQAYRKLAHQCHPDRNSTDAQAKERFEKLAASYQLLLSYWETVGGDASRVIPLTQEGVGKTLVVISKERRPDFLGV
ncbi:MAG: GvpL/GvpF family gas vesicle protein [candidate division NC10 bacterium]|nr:GvpL/GvpF family gas vesicle protein [candidate division NC10 bacterium]